MNNSVFVGHWKNPKKGTKGISHFDIVQEGDSLAIRVTGAAYDLPNDWGKTPLVMHSGAPNADEATAFQATYQRNGLELFLAGNINKGLIIIAMYAKPLQQNGKVPFFIREFFYKK